MPTAKAATNESGDNLTLADSKIGYSGHESSPDKYKSVDFTHSKSHIIFHIKNKNTRLKRICETLLELGFDERSNIIIKDDSKTVQSNLIRKNGTKAKDGRSKSKHMAVDFKRNGLDIRVMIGSDVLKIGVLRGREYEFYRSVSYIKRLINNK